MKYDKPLIAGLIGAISTLSGEACTQLLPYLGFGNYSIYQWGSLLITANRPIELLGFLLEFFLGGLTGIVFYYALSKIGPDYLLIKSIIVSILFWIAAEVFSATMIEGRLVELRAVSDHYVHFAGAVAFGITQGLLFQWYLFENTNKQIS